jgi:hypothetical protein
MEKIGDFIKRYFADSTPDLNVSENAFRRIRAEMLAARDERPLPTLAELIRRSKINGPETPATELAAGQLQVSGLPAQADISGTVTKSSQGFDSPGSTTVRNLRFGVINTELFDGENDARARLKQTVKDVAEELDRTIMGMTEPKILKPLDRAPIRRPDSTAWVIAQYVEFSREWIAENQGIGGNYQAATKEEIRTLGQAWRAGDRLVLVGKWFELGEELDWLAVLFSQMFSMKADKRPSRGDVEVWTLKPQAPLRVDLKPRAKDIAMSQICADCGKPAFTHRYENDPNDMYGQRGQWTCLPVGDPAIEDRLPQRGFDEWDGIGVTREDGGFTDSRERRRAKAALDQIAALREMDARGRKGAIRKPAKAAPAAPPVIARATRQYDDDF